MQLTDETRVQLANELLFVVERMRDNQSDVAAQLYFFSAAFGMVSRLLNQAWDAELVLIHSVLQSTYVSVNNRLQMSASGRERFVEIPGSLMSSLVDTTEQLEKAIRGKKDAKIHSILARFSELAYATTGNGYYLFLKGLIKL